jgi:hypothetical protein
MLLTTSFKSRWDSVITRTLRRLRHRLPPRLLPSRRSLSCHRVTGDSSLLHGLQGYRRMTCHPSTLMYVAQLFSCDYMSSVSKAANSYRYLEAFKSENSAEMNSNKPSSTPQRQGNYAHQLNACHINGCMSTKHSPYDFTLVTTEIHLHMTPSN